MAFLFRRGEEHSSAQEVQGDRADMASSSSSRIRSSEEAGIYCPTMLLGQRTDIDCFGQWRELHICAVMSSSLCSLRWASTRISRAI